MSKLIGFVGEGKTDLIVFKAVLQSIDGGDAYTVTHLQPPSDQLLDQNDQGEHGGGWKGVLSWCLQRNQVGDLSDILGRFACLVVHLDADILDGSDRPNDVISQPCPPVESACQIVENLILRELGVQDRSRISLMIPSKATEAWLIPIFFSTALPEDIECNPDPARWLIGRHPRFVRKKDTGLRKVVSEYSKHSAAISEKWNLAVLHCSSAKQFTADLSEIL